MTLGGVEVDFCQACSGLWLDGGEAQAVFGGAVQLAAGSTAADGGPCPACAAAGRPSRLEQWRVEGAGDLEVDVCRGCGGVWLDRGELRALERLARSGSKRGAAPPPSSSPPSSPPPPPRSARPAPATAPASGAAAAAAGPGGHGALGGLAQAWSGAAKRKPRRLVGGLALLGALVLGFAGLAEWREQSATDDHVAVDATVQHAAVDSRRVRRSSSSSGSRWRKEYRLEVIYTYEVDGRTYTGDRVGRGQDDWSRTRPSRRFRPGEQVTAWHDPDDPGQAVLLRGTGFGTTLQVLGAAALGVYGLLVLLGRAPAPSMRFGGRRH